MTDKRLSEILKLAPTPCYVFDGAVLARRIEALRKALPPGVLLCYAAKANPFLLGEMRESVERLELCSPGEAKICLGLGMKRERMVISGVYKSPDFMEELMRDCPDIGIYTVESMGQLRLLDGLSKKYGRRLSLLLRKSSGNQFGMDGAEIEEIIERRAEYPNLNLLGLQFFSGTQKFSIKKLKRELAKLDEFMDKLREKYDFSCEELEIGPGLPVAYFEDEDFDETEFLREFSAALSAMANRPRLSLELGRSIAASCGEYLTSIVDLKKTGGESFAIVDGGIHHIVYFGQMMAMRVPRHEIFPKREGTPERYNICGSLCTTADIIVKQLPLSSPEPGDVICFQNTGAYSCTEGISLFLSRDLPAVIISDKNGDLRLARAETPTYTLNGERGEL